MCQPGIGLSLAQVRPTVLIIPRLFFFFRLRFFAFLATTSPRIGSQAGVVGQTSCLCHQPSLALSILPHRTDDGHLNGSIPPPPRIFHRPCIQRNHRYSSPLPPPASLFCVLTHSYVNSKIKHMVLICNKSTVTQCDFLHRMFLVRVTRHPAPVCV